MIVQNWAFFWKRRVMAKRQVSLGMGASPLSQLANCLDSFCLPHNLSSMLGMDLEKGVKPRATSNGPAKQPRKWMVPDSRLQWQIPPDETSSFHACKLPPIGGPMKRREGVVAQPQSKR